MVQKGKCQRKKAKQNCAYYFQEEIYLVKSQY